MSPLRLPSVTLLRTQSDDKLVALARDGWEPAFAALVERHRREVMRACARVLPEARAEDATQQVFMAAWRALGRGDEVRDVRPWLLRIARNTALNALRVPGYDHAELVESLRATEAPQTELERREVVRQTLTGLAALPERQRQALLRSAVDGASHAEIAAGLGIKEGAARQLVLRARSTLRGAATALTPVPVLTWALTRAGEVSVAEIAAGGSAAGAAGLLAKAGVVAVVAGGAVATPVAVRHHATPRPAAVQAAEVAPARHEPKPTPAAAAAAPMPTATATATAEPVTPHRVRPVATATSRPVVERGDDERGRNRGPGGGGDDPIEVEHQTPKAHHGPGRGGDEAEDAATPAPTITVTPTRSSNSGPGSSHGDDDADEQPASGDDRSGRGPD